jgi:ABC-type sugar transport system permease subunit
MFTAPALIVYLGFVFVPVFVAVYYSFFKWDGNGAPSDFRGLWNYTQTLTDKTYLMGILHNGFYVIGSIAIQGPLALLFALLLNRLNKGGTFFRLFIFAPYVLSEAMAAIAWRMMLMGNKTGALNGILDSLGLIDKPIDWLGNPSLTNWVVLTIITWKYLGFAITLFLAGMQGIPEELQEAAQVDGAGYWQIQWKITFPLLGPTMRIWAFLSMIGAMQLFDMPYLLNMGRPVTGNQTMATMMIMQLDRHAFGRSSAMAVIMFIICLAVALVYQRLIQRRDTAGALTRGVY